MASLNSAPERIPFTESRKASPATASFHRFRRVEQLIQAERKWQPYARGATTSTLRQPQTGDVGGTAQPGVSLDVSSLRGPCESSAPANGGLFGVRAQEDNEPVSRQQVTVGEGKSSSPVQTRQASLNKPQRDAPESRVSTGTHQVKVSTEPTGLRSGCVSSSPIEKTAATAEHSAAFPARPFVPELAKAPSSLRRPAAAPAAHSAVPLAEVTAPPARTTKESLFANFETVGLAPFRIQLGRKQDVTVELLPPIPTQAGSGGLIVIDLRAAGTRGKREVFVFESCASKVSVYMPPGTASPLSVIPESLPLQRVYLRRDLVRLFELEASGVLVEEERRCARMTRMAGQVLRAVRARTPLLSYEELRYPLPESPRTGSPRAGQLELSVPLRSRITVFSDSPQPTYAVSISSSSVSDGNAALECVLELHVSSARDRCRFRLDSRNSSSATATGASDHPDEICLALMQSRWHALGDELTGIEAWLDARCDAMSQTKNNVPPAMRRSFLALARYWISLEAQAQIRTISSAHRTARQPVDRLEPPAETEAFIGKTDTAGAGPSLEIQLAQLIASVAGMDDCATVRRSRPAARAVSHSPRSPDRRCLPGLGWILRCKDSQGDQIHYTALFLDGRELRVSSARNANAASTFLIDAKGRRYPLSRPKDLPKGTRKRLPFLAEMLLLFEDEARSE